LESEKKKAGQGPTLKVSAVKEKDIYFRPKRDVKHAAFEPVAQK
jgi:hypothetical protein